MLLCEVFNFGGWLGHFDPFDEGSEVWGLAVHEEAYAEDLGCEPEEGDYGDHVDEDDGGDLPCRGRVC